MSQSVLSAGAIISCVLAASGTVNAQQRYLPNGIPSQAVESFIDEYGREVFLDINGRVVAVIQPDRAPQGGAQFDSRGSQVFDRPPPPGVTLEGPAFIEPGQQGFGNGGGFDQAPNTIDPYDNRRYESGPVEASPLPAPDGGLMDAAPETQSAELPQSEVPPLTPQGEVPPLTPQSDVPPLTPQSSDVAELPAPGAPIVNDGASSVGEFLDQQFREQTIQETDPAPQVATPQGPDKKAAVAALQVILDRAGMSPGVIDGRMGSNVNKAVAAYEEKYGRKLSTGDSRALAEELDRTGGPAVVTYELTAEDVAGPFVASIPTDYAEKAQLDHMSFETPTEKLAEQFHMDEDYLKAINPGADFTRAGTRIKVMSVGQNVTGKVARIVADKGREQVRVYDAMGDLIAAYPSTIGSSSTPSPSGTVQVNRIAFDPNYTYNPKINFKQGENDKVLTIPPGPNGPVGSVWIALSKPTYGIHGTPEPSKIGKTNSHGCVRLTNWDAYELAKMVKPGVTVEFVD
ncbi:L,D-transpeptidase family protein [Fulvimarina endophytica]|uniref:L,D-transpeptidase family protein n=1 Tax=Fulvimarina endophytica TaxID=2293836 RepID=UPI001FE060EA|nr:L,D-transpeptidase [Fulvimarina endophytica]